MMSTNDATAQAGFPAQSPALVLERWNSWARVFLPDSNETRWVDLGQSAYQPLSPEESAALEDQGPSQ